MLKMTQKTAITLPPRHNGNQKISKKIAELPIKNRRSMSNRWNRKKIANRKWQNSPKSSYTDLRPPQLGKMTKKCQNDMPKLTGEIVVDLWPLQVRPQQLKKCQLEIGQNDEKTKEKSTNYKSARWNKKYQEKNSAEFPKKNGNRLGTAAGRTNGTNKIAHRPWQNSCEKSDIDLQPPQLGKMKEDQSDKRLKLKKIRGWNWKSQASAATHKTGENKGI